MRDQVNSTGKLLFLVGRSYCLFYPPVSSVLLKGSVYIVVREDSSLIHASSDQKTLTRWAASLRL